MSTIYTARHGAYAGKDALDIARSSAKQGVIWAPSWKILSPVLKLRKDQQLSEFTWQQYVEDFTEEMRTSYRQHRLIWEGLLSRSELTLLCYCTNPKQCHRTIVARDILPAFGATYGGERGAV